MSDLEVCLAMSPFVGALVVFLVLAGWDKARAGREVRRRLDAAVAEEYRLLVEVDRAREVLAGLAKESDVDGRRVS